MPTMFTAILTISMLLPGCEDCLVENTGQPCVDMIDTQAAQLCHLSVLNGDTSPMTCIRTMASLWGNTLFGVGLDAALTAYRIQDEDCMDPDKILTPVCVDLLTECEGYESPASCLAMSVAGCEAEAWAGSGDAAGLVCASAID